MNQEALKRLVWLAVMSYLIPPVISVDGCAIGTSVVEGVCSTVATVTGVAGGVLCGLTFGLGCIISVAATAAGTACASAAGSVSCDGSTISAATVVHYMKDISSKVEDLKLTVDLGFFESTYNDDMNTIRKALDSYDHDIIEKSSEPGKKGYIVESDFVKDWVEKIIGDGDLNVQSALEMIEDMIEGRASLTRTPSVYELADEHRVCGPDLYNFITDLVIGGSTIVFVALQMKSGYASGYGVHEADKEQLRERLMLNAEMFKEYCPDTWVTAERSGTADGNQSRATCPLGYVVSYCEAETGLVDSKCDGTLVDSSGTVCIAYNGHGGDGTIARAKCSKSERVPNPCGSRLSDKPNYVRLHSRANNPGVSCPSGYEQVVCNAQSPWQGLLSGVNSKGVIPNSSRCFIYGCTSFRDSGRGRGARFEMYQYMPVEDTTKWCEVTAVCKLSTTCLRS